MTGSAQAVVAREAVDLERLAAWMDAQGLERGPIGETHLLTGGTQNILLLFTRGERRFVLRRPPANPRPGNDVTMAREMRVLAALAGSGVPHPGFIAGCETPDVLGAAFFLMEPIDGFNPTNGLPALHAGDDAVQHRMGMALVDGAAALSRVDYIAAGLESFGNPENYLGRQAARWRKQLDGYAVHDGWPGPDGLPHVRAVEAYLHANVPAAFRPGVMHGDYHMGNVLYRKDGPELAAIVDWELATIGDPLIDLAWLVATWRGAGGPDLPILRVEPWRNFPRVEELIAAYARQSDRDLSALDWYVVLACYKLAIILEGTYARAHAGAAAMEMGLMLHEASVKALQRAMLRIG
ncbi:MAG: phosphotransferase family protein [Hyphomonadaceae bacterium]